MTRSGAVEVVARGPCLDAVERVFSVETILPTQFARGRARSPGPTALLAAVLTSALEDAGLGKRRAPPPRSTATSAHIRRTLAHAWLLGALDDQVAVPIALACDALGIDAGALATVVRQRGVQSDSPESGRIPDLVPWY